MSEPKFEKPVVNVQLRGNRQRSLDYFHNIFHFHT